jgi:hypothetical protein
MDLDRLIAEARDPQTDESDFKRYFLNRPTAREAGLFIPGPTWDALTEPELVIPAGLFDVAELAYDPRYLERSAELVAQRLPGGFVYPVEPSSRNMREALQVFYRVVTEGKLRHRGDPVIAAHLANAGVERRYSDEIRRVRKIDERKPIDAVPAMALAVWRAVQVPVGEASWVFV